MSYSATFSGLYFRTKRPYREVAESFKALKTKWAPRWNDEVYLRCEGDEEYDGPCEAEVCSTGHGLTDGRVIHALCEWTQQWLGSNETVGVYQASSTDAPADDPFFYLVTQQGISTVSVAELFDVYKLFKSFAAQRKPPLKYADLAEGTEPGIAGAAERLRRMSAVLKEQQSQRASSTTRKPATKTAKAKTGKKKR